MLDEENHVVESSGNVARADVPALAARTRGEYCLEVVEPCEVLVFLLAYGCLQVTRQRAGQPASYCLHATTRAPLMLINPGTYCVVPERSALGLRGTRRKS